MPEAFAQLGAAYQQNGPRPIPAGWPRQNPVSWADTPDPASGMTPRQLGQGVIGAGKEVPQLMQAALPQADVVGETRNPMADTAIGRVLNRYIFDPMTIRGPAQQTGARMMDVLSLLHGMSPAGMEETPFDPRIPEYLSGGVPSRALPLKPRALPLVEGQFPEGSIGTEALKAGEMAPRARAQRVYQFYHRRIPEGMTNPRDFFRIVKSSLKDRPYHVIDEINGRYLSGEGFDTREEADKFIDQTIYAWTPPKPREIQSWKWPYDISPVSRDYKGLLSPKRPPLPWEGGDIQDYYSPGNGGRGGNGGNGH